MFVRQMIQAKALASRPFPSDPALQSMLTSLNRRRVALDSYKRHQMRAYQKASFDTPILLFLSHFLPILGQTSLLPFFFVYDTHS
jgi:hypothetical protein